MKQTRPIREIAFEIRHDWGGKTSPYARDYIDAMLTLDKITDKYYYDTARGVVGYFLANASTWRGETARRIKKELNEMIR